MESPTETEIETSIENAKSALLKLQEEYYDAVSQAAHAKRMLENSRKAARMERPWDIVGLDPIDVDLLSNVGGWSDSVLATEE